MKIINREMVSITKETAMCGYNCQASFNSSGNITLRNYNPSERNKDEIIILGENETRAIIDLFRLLKQHDILPF